MKVMLIVRATPATEAGSLPQDDTLRATLAAYHEALARAGVLLDAAGLQPSAMGWQIRYQADGSQCLVDGPFAAAPAPIAGYTLIEVRSRDEAMEWARRFPAPMGAGAEAVLEVRPLVEPDDLPQGGGVERFRAAETRRPA